MFEDKRRKVFVEERIKCETDLRLAGGNKSGPFAVAKILVTSSPTGSTLASLAVASLVRLYAHTQ